MKFKQLEAIGHNIADSLGCGCGFPIGLYFTDVFGEASRSPDGFVVIDFLAGNATSGQVSTELAGAIAMYRDALVALCEKHGTPPSAFNQLTVRYSMENSRRKMLVTVGDHLGHRSTKEYEGLSARRTKVLDPLGRVRPKIVSPRRQTRD
jgi:hypothetical protein